MYQTRILSKFATLWLLGQATAGFGAGAKSSFSADLLPKDGQRLKLESSDQKITQKTDKASVIFAKGFYTYSSWFLPLFHYLPESQQLTFPGYVATQAPTMQQNAEGTQYLFEAHDTFDSMDKFGHIEVQVGSKGRCTMSWNLKVILRSEIHSQASGSVSYRCGGGIRAISQN